MQRAVLTDQRMSDFLTCSCIDRSTSLLEGSRVRCHPERAVAGGQIRPAPITSAVCGAWEASTGMWLGGNQGFRSLAGWQPRPPSSCLRGLLHRRSGSCLLSYSGCLARQFPVVDELTLEETAARRLLIEPELLSDAGVLWDAKVVDD